MVTFPAVWLVTPFSYNSSFLLGKCHFLGVGRTLTFTPSLAPSFRPSVSITPKIFFLLMKSLYGTEKNAAKILAFR